MPTDPVSGNNKHDQLPIVESVPKQEAQTSVVLSGTLMERALRISDCAQRVFAVIGVGLLYLLIVPVVMDVISWVTNLSRESKQIPTPIIRLDGPTVSIEASPASSPRAKTDTIRGEVQRDRAQIEVGPGALLKPKEEAAGAAGAGFAVKEISVNEEKKGEMLDLLKSWCEKAKEKYAKAHQGFIEAHPLVYKNVPSKMGAIFSPDFKGMQEIISKEGYREFPSYMIAKQKEKSVYIPFKNRNINRETDLINEVGGMSRHMMHVLQKAEGTGLVDFDTFVISESKGLPQAIAFYNSTNHEIAYLVTNPDNVKHPLNRECRVRGAGGSIVFHCGDKARESGRPLILDAVRKAVPFYERVGFVEDITRRPHEEGEIPMMLTASKIHQLVVKD